jgi:hypothetical protein
MGGGAKVRRTPMRGTETLVSYHHVRDAVEPLITASIDITNAEGLEAMMKKARYKKGPHEHEESPDGPQPRKAPCPSQAPETSERGTDRGHGDDDAETGTGVWIDWIKGEQQLFTQKSTQPTAQHDQHEHGRQRVENFNIRSVGVRRPGSGKLKEAAKGPTERRKKEQEHKIQNKTMRGAKGSARRQPLAVICFASVITPIFPSTEKERSIF